MDMVAVDMRCDEKGVFAFCPAHSRFVSYAVGFLRRYFAGNKRLPDLIAQNIRVPFLLPARDSFVFGFGKQKFRVGGFMVAHIRGNQFALLRFLRVLP
jgi:hypothetical protein